MLEEIIIHCTSKIGKHIATINNTVQKAKDEIDKNKINVSISTY